MSESSHSRVGIRRLAGLCAGLAVTAALFGAAPAMATVTSSKITSMTTADGYTSANPIAPMLFSGYDSTATPAQQVSVSGTTTTDDNNAADTVDVRCYYGDGGEYNTLAYGVPVNPADGTFSVSGDANNVDDYTCRMAAVDSSYSDPLDYGKYAGPIYGIGYQSDTSKISTGGPNDGARYDYFSDSHMLKGAFELESSGDCGIESTSSINAAFYDNFDEQGFADCAAALFTNGSGDGYGRSEIQVDGKNAYNSYGAYWINGYNDGSNWHGGYDNANFPAMSYSNKVDPLTGNQTTTESEALVNCGSADFASTTAQCDPANPYTFGSTGVRFDRTYTTGADGQRITVADTYTSTDGQAHSLDVEYDNYSYESTAVFKFPGSAGFNNYYSDDSVTLPAKAVGTIFTQDEYYPSAQDESRPSSLTYLTQPDRAFFSSSDEFALQYRRTVPAGGSLTITHVYNYATTPEDVQALAAQTEDAAQPPAVAITSPANGASVAAGNVTVTGAASDDSGKPTVKVNGIPTSVSPDGTWSQQVPVAQGGNPITAVATDPSGNTAQASETVYAGAAQCTVPNVVGKKTSDAIAALTAAGCKVGAQSTGTSKTVPSGRVISQGIPAGLSGQLGLPVGLRISVGKFTGATLVSKSIHLNGRSLVVTVRCGNSPVQTGTVKLRTQTGKKRTLGTAAFACPKNKKRTVHFTISGTSAKALKKQGRTRAIAFINARNSSGDVTNRNGRLIIKG